jgi:hypothetical protein
MALQRLRDVQLRVPIIKGPAFFKTPAVGLGMDRGDKGAAVGTRIRDGLLRDNKVVPAVLATLALLVFTWLVVAAFARGGSNEESGNQVSLAQNEEGRIVATPNRLPPGPRTATLTPTPPSRAKTPSGY